MAIAFSMKQGVSFPKSWTVYDVDIAGVKTPFDLTGCVIKSQARSEDFVVTFDTAVIDPLMGQYELVAPLGTLGFPVGTIYWDVVIEKDGNRITSQTSAFNVTFTETQI